MASATTHEPPRCAVVLSPQAGRSVAPSLIREAYNRHRQENDGEPIRWLVAHPEAPEDWLLELCERGEFLDDLGHRRGPRKLLEAMASRHHYPEAILTLGKALYRDRAETVEQLRAFLREHTGTLWLFELLPRETPDPPEKEQILIEVASTLPEADRIRQLLEERKQEEVARTTADLAEIERLYRLQQPRTWLGLARNPHTPEPLLRAMCEIKEVRYARNIRAQAAANLARRAQS